MSNQDVVSDSRRRGGWSRGPKVLVWIGVALAGIALLAVVLGIVRIVTSSPGGAIDENGQPGSEAIASGPLPGPVQVTVESRGVYLLWEVLPGEVRNTLLPNDMTVTSADGVEVWVDMPTSSSSEVAGDYRARPFAEVSLSSGEYTIEVEERSVRGEMFVMTEGRGMEGAMADFLTVAGLFVLAVIAVVLGAILLIAGAIWGSVSASRSQPTSP